MDMQQNTVETITIKTEIPEADDEFSQHNGEIPDNILAVEDIKKEETVAGDTDSGLEESLLVKTEFKSEDTEEHDFVTPEYVDLRGCSLPGSANAIEDPLSGDCDRKYDSKELQKQWMKIKVNQLKLGVTNFKSKQIQRGNDVSFSCCHCDYSTTIKRNLVRHMSVHDKRKKEVFSCANCDYTNNHKRCLLRHMRVHSDQERTIFSCDMCSFKTLHKESLRRHTIHIHLGNYKRHSCMYCEKHFKNKASLDGHLLKKHQNVIVSVSSKVHSCPSCSYKTTIKSHFTSHIVKVHSGDYKKHWCTFCDRYFKSKRSLDDHILKNHQNCTDLVSSRVHNCSTCDYKTTIRSNLSFHTVKVHSANCKVDYSCTFCNRQFKGQGTLSNHIIKNHCGEFSGWQSEPAS